MSHDKLTVNMKISNIRTGFQHWKLPIIKFDKNKLFNRITNSQHSFNKLFLEVVERSWLRSWNSYRKISIEIRPGCLQHGRNPTFSAQSLHYHHAPLNRPPTRFIMPRKQPSPATAVKHSPFPHLNPQKHSAKIHTRTPGTPQKFTPGLQGGQLNHLLERWTHDSLPL